MSDVRLRHEWRQAWLAFDAGDPDRPIYYPWEVALHEELTRRLALRPLQECVCEECWPTLAHV